MTVKALLAAVLLCGLAGIGAAQGDQPGWADDLFGRMERAAEEYNAGVGSDDRGALKRWLLSDARVNLYVEGPDGSEAVASFRTDDNLRITRLQRGPYEHPTLRVRTSKTAIERIADADDPPAAIESGIRSGRIRVKKIYEPLPGVLVAVGVGEAILGAGSLVLATAAVAKFGVQGILTALRGGAQKLLPGVVSAGRTLWEDLGRVATLLTVLDQLGLLERMKGTVVGVYDRMRTAVLGMEAWLGLWTTATDDDEREE